MPTARNPKNELREARQIARDHGCFVVTKKDGKGKEFYILYRCLPERNTSIGQRSTPADILKLVKKATGFH